MTVTARVKSSKLKQVDLKKMVKSRAKDGKPSEKINQKRKKPVQTQGSGEVPSVGSIVSGEVTGSGERGVFVRLTGSGISGRIRLCDIATRFVSGDEVAKMMPVGSTISGLVVATADTANKRVDLKLQTRLGDPEVGSVHKAIVKRVERYGVIMTFPNSLIRCLCVPEEVHEDMETARAMMAKMQPGHKYSVKVIRVEQGKIWASMKDTLKAETYDQPVMEFTDPIVEEVAVSERPKLIDETEIQKAQTGKRTSSDALEDDEEDEGEQPGKKKANKRQRDAMKKEKEALIREKEEAIMSGEWRKDPQSSEEFERLILEDKSAAVWIKYMSHWLKMAEVGKARESVERGLKQPTMSEEDKFNLWIAYLNMEVAFGNAAEDVFVRAAQFCDTKKIYHAMPQVYVRAGHSDKAVVAFERMLSKFPQSRKAYMNYIEYLFNSDRPEDARVIYTKALKNLPKHKHIRSTTKFAQLEFRNGFPERGTSVFEQLLQSGSNLARTDIWSIFFDETIKANTPPVSQSADPETVRALFEKALAAKLKPKKMKSFFKRWLDFETKFGSDTDVENVKNRAVEYVESLNE
jgi:rRNA biogenesis protein RRP5